MKAVHLILRIIVNLLITLILSAAVPATGPPEAFRPELTAYVLRANTFPEVQPVVENEARKAITANIPQLEFRSPSTLPKPETALAVDLLSKN